MRETGVDCVKLGREYGGGVSDTVRCDTIVDGVSVTCLKLGFGAVCAAQAVVGKFGNDIVYESTVYTVIRFWGFSKVQSDV